MRTIPKKTRQKNTVWRCYTLPDVIFALVLFIVVFVLISSSKYVLAVIFALVTIGLMMPTQDGVAYTILWGLLKYLFSVRRHESKASGRRGMENLLSVRAITDGGALLYAGGTAARVIEIGEKNFGCLSFEDQNIDIEAFSAALKCAAPSETIDLVKVERAMDFSAFLEDANAEIAAAESSFVVGAKLSILKERRAAYENLCKNGKRYVPAYFIVVYARSEEEASGTAKDMSSLIAECGLNAKILGMRDAAVFLKNTFTRDFDPAEADTLSASELLKWALPKCVSFSSAEASSDGLAFSVFAVSDYPLRVGNAWGAGICGLDGTKTILRMRPVEREKAIKRIDRSISDTETRAFVSEKASDASMACTARDTMEELLSGLQRDGETLFDVTLTVTAFAFAGTGLSEIRKGVKCALQTDGFRVSNLRAAQKDGFLCSVPEPSGKISSHERGINSSALAAFFPFVRTRTAERGGVQLGLSGVGAYPFILNIWKRDAEYQNSNAMVIGRSGSGKSYFMKSLIAAEMSRGTRVMILDPESEYGTLTGNLAGDVVDVGNSRAGRLNPFHVYRILTEDGAAADSKVTFHTHLKTLEAFFRVAMEGAPAETLELINSLTLETYLRRGITEKTDTSGFSPEMFPTFSDLSAVIEEKLTDPSADELTKNELRKASLHLQKFSSGRYSDIWNGPSTMSADSKMVDFDFQSLFASKNGIVANAQMLLVFRFMEQEIINGREASRKDGERRTLIVVDEAHLFVDPKFPVALDFFYSMCKRIRKYGGAFIPATQSIGDWEAGEELKAKTSAIMKNSQYMFVFRLSAPDMKDLKELFRSSGGFDGEEERRILSLPTGSAYFVGSGGDRTTLRVRTSAGVAALFGEENLKGEDCDE
ncbi:MAG: DUF87 domain-containing protein [Clostridia bacterium]|nr:DUF87 domain-containing protein [Clostridia bacterium]